MMDVAANDGHNDNSENHDQKERLEQEQVHAADAIIADSDSHDSHEDDDNDDDDDGDDEDEEEEEEEEEGDSDDESAIAADTIIVRANRRAKLLSLLDQYEECPFRTRNHVDELVEELLEKAEDGIHRMLCDQHADHYRGLDSNRDTEKEVETVFLAQLAIEFGSFADHERGGLLIDDWLDENTLQNLFHGSDSSYGHEYNQLVENVVLAQLMRLKQMTLFKKEDICEYRLVHKAIRNRNGCFPETRFRFLVEADPTALLQLDEEGRLPLHCVAMIFPIAAIRRVFDYYIRYYPKILR